MWVCWKQRTYGSKNYSSIKAITLQVVLEHKEEVFIDILGVMMRSNAPDGNVKEEGRAKEHVTFILGVP